MLLYSIFEALSAANRRGADLDAVLCLLEPVIELAAKAAMNEKAVKSAVTKAANRAKKAAAEAAAQDETV